MAIYTRFGSRVMIVRFDRASYERLANGDVAQYPITVLRESDNARFDVKPNELKADGGIPEIIGECNKCMEG